MTPSVRTGFSELTQLEKSALVWLWNYPDLVICSASVSNSSNNVIDVKSSEEKCNVIDSLSITNEVESTGVTTFVQEACEAVDVMGAHYSGSSLLKSQGDLQDLKEYFRRPRIVRTGELNSVRSSDGSVSVDRVTLFGNIFPDGFERLAGVFGVRFKMVFTLQVAATPFHQGVAAVSFQYFGSDFARYNSISTCTNIPHVRLDVSSSTMAQLHVPFLWIGEFLPLRKGQTLAAFPDILGVATVHNLLGVPVVTGLKPVTYKLFVHLEDMELVGAVPTDVALQAGKKVSPVTKEFENDAYPFSSSLHAMSKTARWIAKGVPALSSLAGPTSWFLGKASGVVRYLGYSKPQVQEPVMRMIDMGSALEHNVDTPSSTIMVSAMASNYLKVDPSFAGSDVDEMSLSYVLSQWGQVYYGSITTDAPVGSVVYSTGVSPSYAWYRDISAPALKFINRPYPRTMAVGANAFQPTSLLFWSSMFRQWRGSIEYRFTFAKTKMHGGRVLVTFVPRRDNVQTNEANPDSLVMYRPGTASVAGGSVPVTDGYSAIFDLRDGNVFTFTCPYVSDCPYTNFFGRVGDLSIVVLDPITASTSSAQYIDFLVEARAGSNFELAIPIGPLAPVHVDGTVSVESGKLISTISEEASELTVGEVITSAKQLIQIPKWTSISMTGTSSRSITLPPWTYQPKISVLTPLVLPLPPESFGFQGNIASCYLYARGSQDVHFYANTTSNMLVSARQGVVPFNDYSYALYNRSSTATPRVVTSKGPAHLRFPAQQQYVRWRASYANDADWSPAAGKSTPVFPVGEYYDPAYYNRVTLANVPSSVTNVPFGRAAGDDAMLGHYMGPPPLARVPFNELTSNLDPDEFY